MRKALLLLSCAWLVAVSHAGQTIVFPEKANVLDSTKPCYNADNTGHDDVTGILSRALLDMENRDRPCPHAQQRSGRTLVCESTSLGPMKEFGPGDVHLRETRNGRTREIRDGANAALLKACPPPK